MPLFLLLAISGFLCPLLLAAEPEAVTIAEVMARMRALRAAIDFRANGRLVRITGSGERKAYQLALRGKWFADGLKIFCEVRDPAPSRIRILLQTDPAGKTTIRTGHAGDRMSKETPFESWGEPFLDSDLTYEDMIESHCFWRNQTLVKEEKYGSRNCFLVRSEPGASDRSHYLSATSWLDQEVLYPVRVEKVSKASGSVKEFISYGLRESRGMWSASQIEVRIKGRQDSTLLILNRGSAKAGLNASDFLPTLLIKPDSH